ncbi:MAG: galactokinase family protein [Eubacteriales bacterium]|nr:galactokinase family protein [Eubacteriales bacterium]
MKIPGREVLEKIYGEFDVSGARYEKLAEKFESLFHRDDAEFFTAPGRTEIVGNHTDHNGGKILAASIDMDTIGAAASNTTGVITIISEGYSKPIVVDLKNLADAPKEQGSVSLVAGMAEAVQSMGYRVGGFDAYVSTEVIPSAGVSSSASFEMLVCAILNYFYNENRMTYAEYARIGQYAENHFWNKASGLMDQMACAAGGAILLDFSDGVKCEKRAFSFSDYGYELVIVNTGKGHADLSAEYSSIPNEMKAVAAELGVSLLCESSKAALMEKLPEIRKKLGNDRAILRALHFYTENERVEEIDAAIAAGDKDAILAVLTASGNSSWKWLQNCHVATAHEEQSICMALALTEMFLKEIGDGACRIHGGGFAGVIMAAVPKERVEEYKAYIGRLVGEENVHPMNIRQTGAVHVE